MSTTTQDPSFEPWLEQQLQHSARAMLASVSPVGIVKHRPGFGQTVQPVPGAIVASPVLADWKPDPDYFFHWYRDSAMVVDALRLLHAERRIGDEALQHLRDFTRFSLAVNKLDGSAVAATPGRRRAVAPEFLQYLRPDAELARVRDDRVAAEARVNPDGTLDISRWSRPQHDGPALRALALMRWSASGLLDAPRVQELFPLIRFDLGFTLRHWRDTSFDIWEEDDGHHYYTLHVCAQALAEGAQWMLTTGDAAFSRLYAAEARSALGRLDAFWSNDGHYRARHLPDGRPGQKTLDIAVILSAIHARGPQVAHSVADPRMHETLARLDALFASTYAINRDLGPQRGTAMGRYAGDVYFSGGAYYFSTLGAAEFCFLAAQRCDDAHEWFRRGDAYLATVRAHTPDSGDLSEQFDQNSGAQTSARHLAWSYAAFISCVNARREAALRLR